MIVFQINLDPEVVLALFSESNQEDHPRKRAKLSIKSKSERIAEYLKGESSEEQENRLLFTLEILCISTVNFASATPELVKRLFDFVEKYVT